MKQEKLVHLVATAQRWAQDLHAGQKYGNKDYYLAHIEPVVEMVEYLTCDNASLSRTEKALVLVIAYLHDVVEDTDIILEEVRQAFGSQVARSVLALTKVKGETYETAIARVLRDDLAIWVKKADNMVNLRESMASGNKRLIRKYVTSLETLNDV